MSTRIPYSAKGKGISYYKEAPRNHNKYYSSTETEKNNSYQRQRKGNDYVQDFSAPPPKRIRAPEMDSSDLIRENALTLMGRLTNPSLQRLWSLIPYLSNRWNLKGKAIGSDLGNGCFQFRFEYEEDLTKVLDNRPYHFDQWMVILQKWEPVISTTFPSQIPFWIELQGLPMHFWKQQMIYKIGEELGTVLDHDISPAAAKIKVEINGLEPLTKQTVVEFSDGKEALVTLDYKNLKKHCFHCQRLSHEINSCPGLIKEKEPNNQIPPPPPARNSALSRTNTQGAREYHREKPRESASYHTQPMTALGGAHSNKRKYDDRDLIYYTNSGSRDYGNRTPSDLRSPPRPLNYSRNETRRSMDRHHYNNHKPNLQWRERVCPTTDRTGSSESLRSRRPPLERTSTGEESSPFKRPVLTNEEIMDELREVTVQYTNCADPTESMARKQRVLQGESRGLMAETAAQILAASSLINPTSTVPTGDHSSLNLPQSPDLPIHPALLPATGTTTEKKRRGRPPLNKPKNKSPMRLPGAKSSKRNKELIQLSPRRKLTGDKDAPIGEETTGSTQRKSAKQRLSLPSEKARPSNARDPPQPVIIPAIQKKTVDFQSPLLPLP